MVLEGNGPVGLRIMRKQKTCSVQERRREKRKHSVNDGRTIWYHMEANETQSLSLTLQKSVPDELRT